MLFFIQHSNTETNYLLHEIYFAIEHRYVTELNPDVMKCMAGFSSDEEYYVPRSELAFPDWMNHCNVTMFLFPSIIRCQQEQLHGLGDHSEAAEEFFCMKCYHSWQLFFFFKMAFTGLLDFQIMRHRVSC